ncbi:DNA polymerase IV [Streptomyces sp. NBC_01565]|uniref:DNA polymerase IV n=1 Tax=unclassified Streptomyces TaxID=2593676 RepID=UPI00225B3902|nr:DNA polymerase IV [Streptomyces sp. NBC_01565]MCX4544808.1 DNA polymerase IV [Streptomyces sp. NBC_01565]
MRAAPTILHLDMDAFYASVEQASKPSLRGKAVIVGGLGPRGVVATASYEARRFGVHSAMPMAQARRLCPNGAYLIPRFRLYQAVSEVVMGLLRELSPLVEPLSLDEAFVDLEAGGVAFDSETARATGERLRADIRAATGLSGSVGLAGSKMLAKVASEEAKPAGLLLIEPGTERELLAPMSVRVLPGVGPVTGEHLRRAGITTVGELAEAGEDELVRMLGRSHGVGLYRMALGLDDRPVVAERDTKSVSVEDTFDVDLHDRVRIRYEVQRLADRCVGRLRDSGHSGRTIVLKVRRYDFSTLTRSETLRGPTDDPAVVREAAARLLEAVDTTGGVRLLGVGVSGLADYTQEDLFAFALAAEEEREGRDHPASAGANEPADAAARADGGGAGAAVPAAVTGGAGQSGGAQGAGGVGDAGEAGRTGRARGAGQAGEAGVAGRSGEATGPRGAGATGRTGDAKAEGSGRDGEGGDAGSSGEVADTGGVGRTGEASGVVEGTRTGEGGDAGQSGGPGGDLQAAGVGDAGGVGRVGGAVGGVDVGSGGGAEHAVERRWGAGSDVWHAVYGAGWVQGSGVGRVTVRFERPGSEPGRVRTFRVDDPELEPSDPLPLVGDEPAGE